MSTRDQAMHTLARLNRKLFSEKRNFGRGPMGRGQMHILDEIIANEGLTQDDLAKALKLDKTTIAKAVKRLEMHQLVMRKNDESDKRKKTLFATDEAKKMQRKLQNFREENAQRVFENVSDEEVQLLITILEKIEVNVESRRKGMNDQRRLSKKIIKTLVKSDGMVIEDLIDELEYDEKQVLEVVKHLLSHEMILDDGGILRCQSEFIERRHHDNHHQRRRDLGQGRREPGQRRRHPNRHRHE